MYTVEVFKADKRTKSGHRRIFKQDYDSDNLNMLRHTVATTWPKREGFLYEIHETFVTRKNLFTGEEYQERYDTPWFACPSSETYWS